LILNQADPLLAEKFAGNDRVSWFNSPGGFRAEGRQFYDGGRMLDVEMPVHMPGKHNRSNVAAALSVIREVGTGLGKAILSIQDYKSLPHRLQLLGEHKGTSWINDSISSTPVATAAALESLTGQSVILLIGGLDRGIDWSAYLADFKANVPKALIAMPDNGPAVMDGLSQAGLQCPGGHFVTAGLEEAVDTARRLSVPGDIVLLSPGAPSFPRFVDFQHRGKEFARLAGF
jgi:UDP-N-acetylmuramoylalanine--D-glutamate ligase